ncbi:MAG: hypothetical protein L6R39_002341 [Caloplaca ligustica]|nr:MAG: hypothetical protein L6R39_002341 [Caloplaca ligustica]
MDNWKLPHDGPQSPSERTIQRALSQATQSATTSPVAPSSEKTQPSQQTRRLQLRNAGFRGQTIPIRRISPILSVSGVPSEPFYRVVSNENTPHNLEKRQLFGEDLPPSPVNILQELHNSARRKHHPPRPSIGAIFQDDTATPAADGDRGLFEHGETCNNNTPLGSRNPSVAMNRLREVSGNRSSPPSLSSPLAKHSKNRNGNRVHRRTTSAEAARYIEHLESQLAAVNTKLDSLMSPTSHKIRAAKLRTLTSEARSLRQQVSEWEQKFDEKVKDERNQLAEVEMSLTHRLQALEDEVEAKDNRVRDLEWQLENLKVRVKDAEGLEAVNTDLERRIDLLSNLLVQSPTKLDLCSATTSPSRPSPPKRMTRPRSMMPRVPPSPGSIRLSLKIGSDIQLRRARRSTASTSSASPSADIRPGTAIERGDLQSTEGMKESKDSSELSSGNASSFRSPPSSSSRPTSLYSNGSFGAYSWGLPLPPDADLNGKANHKQRRMRRFPSGAATLKPLILPTAAGTPSLPASAPAQDTFRDTAQQDFSGVSLDPTVAFLSKHEFSSPITTPTQPGRRRSGSCAETEAFSALEARSNYSVTAEDEHAIMSPRSLSEEPLETVEEESFDAKGSKRERPRSLGEELEEVGLLFKSPCDDGLIPFANPGREHSIPLEATPTGSDVWKSYRHAQQQRTPDCKKPETTPRLRMANTQPANCSPRSVARATVATPLAKVLLSRLKGLVSRTKLGPTALARRLVYNAWATGLARLGGLGWWLLGLVYATRWRREKRAADAATTVEEVPTPGMDWHHFSPGASGSTIPGQHNDWCDGRGIHAERMPILAHVKTPHCTPPTQLRETCSTPPTSRREINAVSCPDCKELPTRRSLRLWLRFSLAIVLAVGIAIKDGPGTLLDGCHEPGETMHQSVQGLPQRARSTTRNILRAHGSESSFTTSNQVRLHQCMDYSEPRGSTRAV